MLSFITGKMSVKISLIISAIIIIVFSAGTYFLVSQQTSRLEDELLYRAKIQSVLGAETIGTIIEEAIDNGVFSVNKAFDSDYEILGNFDPPKYHTSYDSYLDRAILSIQDKFLKDDNLIYAVAADRNGYVPTHNSSYQQPITGDPEKDRVRNRTKRIFNDPVGIKAAENKEEGFQQIYHRDTGEVAWDVSSPITVKGKHWGGFRVGVELSSISAAQKQLVKTMGLIMILILVVSLLFTFLYVTKAMAPLRKMTVVARNIAKGNELESEIPVTRKDEIGGLQDALNRLRLSILIALKRKKGK
ncbi:MAG: HAMP domain-containing protein [Desulfosalsimonas sp.]|uniref:HAMP domain-containing protein n=1 Tax=Desulfosalsimonas sp. TaxID=3073848 RepID=UPI003970DBE7